MGSRTKSAWSWARRGGVAATPSRRQPRADRFLPADFGRRAGAGQPAMTPLGQPYLIVARTIKAGDKPTAIITESGNAMGEKLPPLGMENQDAPIYGLKEEIAQRVSQDYQVIAGTIVTGQRTAQGVARAFTKDLSAYLAANVPQSVAVAFVNFPDLDPAGSVPPEDPQNVMRRKVYTYCEYKSWSCLPHTNCSAQNPEGLNYCRNPPGHDINSFGIHKEKSSVVLACNPPSIEVLGFGGSLTTGIDSMRNIHSPGSDCRPAGSICYDTTYSGKITMNAVQIQAWRCREDVWDQGMVITNELGNAAVQVCCYFKWDPDYPATP